MKKIIYLMIILSLFCLFVLSSCDNTDISNDNIQQTTDETNGNDNTSTDNTSTDNTSTDNTSTDSDVCQHIFGEWNVVQNASCNEEGRRVRTCNTCSFAEEEQIQKSEIHTPITDAAVPATCKDTGLTKGSHCSVCSKVLVEQVTVSKLNHTYDQKKTTSEYIKSKATSSAAATYYYSCKCGSKGTTYFSYGSPLSRNLSSVNIRYN